jgi:hypothetical protein
MSMVTLNAFLSNTGISCMYVYLQRSSTYRFILPHLFPVKGLQSCGHTVQYMVSLRLGCFRSFETMGLSKPNSSDHDQVQDRGKACLKLSSGE